MELTVGVFQSRGVAEAVVERLREAGVSEERIGVLTPESTTEELAALPTAESEPPGVGTALGGSIGGAVALGVGSVVFFPVAGPLTALGVLGTGLAGIAGAAGGAALGKAADDAMSHGLPADEIYVYEDAIRNGRSVVLVRVEGEEEKENVDRVFDAEGAESIDAARESWWVGLRDAQALSYTETGEDFDRDEETYKRGFVAALHPRRRGMEWSAVEDELRRSHPKDSRDAAFLKGYERGRFYALELQETMRERHGRKGGPS